MFNLFSVFFAFTCFVVIMFAICCLFVALRELCEPAARGDQLIRRAFLEDLSGIKDDDEQTFLRHRLRTIGRRLNGSRAIASREPCRSVFRQ